MMQLHDGHVTVQKFFTAANASSYDSVARYATFGQDAAWKRRIVDEMRDRHLILELACGTGILTSMLTRAGKSVTGLDLTFHYLAESRKRTDFNIAQGTAEALPHREEQFDAVVSSYLAKYVESGTVVGECKRVLHHGGTVVFHDFCYPKDSVMRRLWKSYFLILRFCGIFSPSWRAVFDELDNFIENSRWEKRTLDALNESGFTNISIKYHTLGTAAIITAEKP